MGRATITRDFFYAIDVFAVMYSGHGYDQSVMSTALQSDRSGEIGALYHSKPTSYECSSCLERRYGGSGTHDRR